MRKYVFILLLALISSGIEAIAQQKLEANKVLSTAVGKLTSSKGIEAQFSVSRSGYTGKGIIQEEGGRFHVALPEMEVWYNGKALYTYNKNTDETTIVTPTREELEASNPLFYITNSITTYTSTFSTVRKEGKYVIELLPKVKNGDINRVTLTVDKKNYLPEKIVVEPQNGSPITAEIKSINMRKAFVTADFEYPRKKYPKAEIIDLR